MNSPIPPTAEEVWKQAPPGPNDALVEAHQFPFPEGLTPEFNLLPSSNPQTNAIRPEVPVATEACAVIERIVEIVEPGVGKVIVAVGAGAVT